MLLGNSIEHPLNKCIEGFTLFVLNIYSKGRPTHIDSLLKLRCYMLSKKQLVSDKLQPTFLVLKCMIYQSHYMTLICKVLCSYKSNFARSRRLRIGKKRRWIRTIHDEQCKKTECDSLRSNCKKKRLVCSNMC